MFNVTLQEDHEKGFGGIRKVKATGKRAVQAATQSAVMSYRLMKTMPVYCSMLYNYKARSVWRAT